MKKVQAGFTLIELMIVVAIIGILAAIAIPQYQTYIIKTQVTRAMGESAAMKTAIETCINDGKTVIGANAGECDPQATSSSILRVTDANAGFATPVGVPVALLPGGGASTITATFGGAANPVLTATPFQVIWTRVAATGSWGCTTTAAMPPKYKPAGCP
jgi:type IV pilus assembly protein PilA